MKRDISNKLKALEAIAPVADQSADVNGATFDKTTDPGFESLMALVHLGASGDTLSGSVKIDLILEESDDDSVWSKVAADDIEVPDAAQKGTDGSGIFQTVDDPAEDEAIYKVGYKGHKRYARVVLDFTGTHTNGIPVAAQYVANHALGEPVS